MISTSRATTTLAVAALLAATLSDSVTARNASVAVKQVAQGCNKCDSPRDWSRITGVCFHDVGDRTNWFIRQPGGDFNYCGCCKVQTVPMPGHKGVWERTTIDDDTYCASMNGQHDITKWYWRSEMHC